MMMLSREMQQRLKKQLAERPLEKGQIRKVEKMGGLYVTLARLESQATESEVIRGGMEYRFLYSLRIESVQYYFYAGTRVLDDYDM